MIMVRKPQSSSYCKEPLSVLSCDGSGQDERERSAAAEPPRSTQPHLHPHHTPHHSTEKVLRFQLSVNLARLLCWNQNLIIWHEDGEKSLSLHHRPDH